MYTITFFKPNTNDITLKLANERTFLAWVRTGSIFVTLGVTFVQFVHLSQKTTSVVIKGNEYDLTEFNRQNETLFAHYGKAIEILTMVLGILSVIFAITRFLHVQSLLTRDYFPASRVKVFILVTINLVMLILLLVLDVKLYR